MRNLVVLSESHGVIDSRDGNEKLQVVAAAVDTEAGHFFVATQSAMLLCFSLSSSQVQWEVPLEEEGGAVVGMEWRVEVEAVVVGRYDGQVVEVRDSGQEIQEVGALEGGLRSMAASPDGEVLLLATGLARLLLMNQDWDLLYDISLGEQLDTSGSVQLSWRGDGKFFATLVTGEADSAISSQLKIWERDAGTLLACGEVLPFKQTAMSWCPSGARIATAGSQLSTPSAPNVVFFEKNGLKRDKFLIESSQEAHVSSLHWNSNSELLALVLESSGWNKVQVWNCNNYHWYLKQEWRFPSSDQVNMLWDPEKSMQLVCWTASGTVQHVKLGWKTAVLEASTALVISGCKLLISPLSNTLIPPPMSLFSITFQAPVQVVAYTQDSQGNGLIAACLSDGSLSVVRCRQVPTCLDLDGENFTVPSVAADLGSPLNLSNLRCLSWLSSGAVLGAVLAKHAGYQEMLIEVQLLQNCNDVDLVCTKFEIEAVHETTLKEGVVSIVKNRFSSEQGSGFAFVQLGNGSVFPYTEARGGLELGRALLGKFVGPSPWMDCVSVGDTDVRLVGMDETGRLEILGHSIICNDCTSFALHQSSNSSSHLLYTTQRDSLHVVDLINLTSPMNLDTLLEQNSKNPNSIPGRRPRGAGVREEELKVRPLWERGSKLVTAVGGNDVAVILQAVRGNLETIYPRGLVLSAIAAALKQRSFKDAMGLARRHHINLNLIVDYGGWQRFCSSALQFVQQVGKLSHITELIYALNGENIVETAYKNLLPPLDDGKAAKVPGEDVITSSATSTKVQSVLRAIRIALENVVPESPARELCILATLAKSQPPELNEALCRIKNLREAELQGELSVELEGFNDAVSQELKRVNLSAEGALTHLLWLSDADVVFKEALGLYDLHLAAMVASHAQKDPKEFLPLLKEYEEMPAHMMRYKIDSRLGRFESALCNLAAGGKSHFGDCLQLMVNHAELFPLGLQIFQERENQAAILEAWGDYLVGEESHEDAAAAFCACAQLQKAMAAYRSAGHWQAVMTIAGRLQLPEEEMARLVSDVGEELQAMGRPAEAARVALEYSQDVDTAVRALLEAREWMEAIRVSSLYDRNELLASLVEPAALECATSLIEEFTEGSEKVGKYQARHQAVQQRRLSLSAKLKAEEDGEWPPPEDDSASETSSHLSSMSAYTRGTMSPSSLTTESRRGGKRSAKSQTKQRSRGGRIRAGSPGEELALVEHVRGMASSQRLLEEVKRLLMALLLFGHTDVAKRVQASLDHFQATQKAAQESMQEDVPSQSVDAPEKIPAVSWKVAILGSH